MQQKLSVSHGTHTLRVSFGVFKRIYYEIKGYSERIKSYIRDDTRILGF